MIDDSDVRYLQRRRHEKKVIAATLLGTMIVLFGAYRLTAVERNREEETPVTAVATDTSTPVSITLIPNLDAQDTVSGLSPSTTELQSPPEPRASKPVRTTNGSISAGTTVDAKLATYLSSRDAAAGDDVVAVTIADVIVNGRVVIPVGTTVTGRVTEAGPGFLRVHFSRIGPYRTRLALVSPNRDQRSTGGGNSTAYASRPENVRMNAGERIVLRFTQDVDF